MTNRLVFNPTTVAPVDSTDINAVLSYVMTTIYSDPANISVFRDSPLLGLIQKITATRDVLNWDIELDDNEATAGPITAPTDSTAIASITKAEKLKAELTIGNKKLFKPVEIENTETVIYGATATGQIGDLLMERFNQAMNAITKSLSARLYTGTVDVNNAITGLDTVFGNNDYAGHTHRLASYVGTTPNVDYYPLYRPIHGNVNTGTDILTISDGHGDASTLVADSTYNLSAASNIIEWLDTFTTYIESKGRFYNLIVANHWTVENYLKAYRDLNSYNVPGGSLLNVDIGYSGISYQGRPVIKDVNCPDNTVYLVDLSKIKMYSIPRSRYHAGDMAAASMGNAFNVIVGEVPSYTTMLKRFEVAVVPQITFDTTGIQRLTWS